MRAWDYSHDAVNIKCHKCPRKGRYSKDRFVELVGKNTQMPDALRIIAKGCLKSPKGLGGLDDRCGAYFPDLGARPKRIS